MMFLNKYIYCFVFVIVGIFSFETMNGQGLNKYKWENRILVIQSEDELLEKYQLQNKEFDLLDEEFRERKLILFRVVGQRYKVDHFEEKPNNSKWEMTDTIYDTFLSQKDTFRIILIGLDGNIKLEKTDVLTKQELFDLIDTMPMRRFELNRK